MKKILSIDDEPALLECISQALKSRGYALVTTTDPLEGLRFLREDQDICLVLLDIKMPTKSGFELYRELMGFRKLPVLFVTGYPHSFHAGSDELLAMWRNHFTEGTTDILYKPFTLTALFEKVASLVGDGEEIGRGGPR